MLTDRARRAALRWALARPRRAAPRAGRSSSLRARLPKI